MNNNLISPSSVKAGWENQTDTLCRGFLANILAQPEYTEILLCKNGAGTYPVIFFRDKSIEHKAFVSDNGFVGLPLLMFTLVLIPLIFIGVHYLILILMNLVLLTERSDRFRQTLRLENDLSVIGIVRAAAVSSTPFLYIFSVLYFSDVICLASTDGRFLNTGGVL